MTLPADTFANGTFNYFKDFLTTNITGNEVFFAILVLTILMVILLSIGLPTKFAFSFFLIGLVSFFAIQVQSGVSSLIGGGQYGWVFIVGIILFMGLIVYLIYNLMHG